MVNFPETVSAYIDPGTGGAIVSSASNIGLILISIFSFLLAFIIRPVGKFIWRRKKMFFIVILILFLLAGAFFFSKNSMTNVSKGTYHTAIVLGIDGFDPKIIDFLIQEGKLNNFKKLQETGSYKRLQTIVPAISPVVWTTIATGVNPGGHGLFDFIRFDRVKKLPFLSIIDQQDALFGIKYNNPIKGTPFWDTLSGEKVPVSVVRWPITFPAQKISGSMLSGLGTPDIRGFLNGYVRYTDKKITDSVTKDRIISVTASDGQVQSELQGQYKTNGEAITEPFVVQVTGEHTATMIVGKDSYPLKKGEWSDWIRIKFKQGFGVYTHAIFKVFPESFEPEFDLFVTSMQFDPKNPDVTISYPEGYSGTLAGEIGTFYTLGMPEDAKAVNDGNVSKAALIAQIDQIRIEREKMFWSEYKKLMNTNGVLAFVFDETDRAQHIFYDQEVDTVDGKVTRVGPILEKVYTDKDAFLGKILDVLPGDAAILVVSDHGFDRFTRAVNLNTWLVENNYLALVPGITLDTAGTLYKNIDWDKTKAYSFGYSSININGNVKEKEKLVEEIVGKLKEMKDPENGNMIVHHVYTKDALYSGSYVDEAGDILVGFTPPYRIDWENPVGGFSKETVTDNVRPWQADHIFDPTFIPGIFFSNFKTNQKTAHVLDIVPTVFKLLELKIPKNYEGKSLL